MKYNRLFLQLIVLFQLVIAMGQPDFSFIHQGAYRNVYEFRNLDPFYTGEIIFSRKAFDTTDHAYYIKTYNKEAGLSRKTVKNEIFAIYYDSSLYLNCYRFSMGDGFAKILNSGRYCYFNGCGFYNQKSTGPVMGMAVIGGAVGVGVSMGLTGSRVKQKDYLFDLNAGNFHPLDSNYLNWILESEIDLYRQFQMESDKTSTDLLLYYVDLINKRSIIEFRKE